jgi:hypothetical protein
MKSRKNMLPVAPVSLIDLGPQPEALLKQQFGFFRYAHGTGADRRATLDAKPCPHCKGKVEWTLTYRREGGEVVPYIYARCRSAPKSHRWDFTHWKPARGVPQTERQTKALLKASLGPARAARAYKPSPPPSERPTPKERVTIPPPRPSVGTELMASWIDKRIDVLSAELDRLSKIRALAGEVAQLEGRVPPPATTAAPSYPGASVHPTPGNGDHTKS